MARSAREGSGIGRGTRLGGAAAGRRGCDAPSRPEQQVDRDRPTFDGPYRRATAQHEQRRGSCGSEQRARGQLRQLRRANKTDQRGADHHHRFLGCGSCRSEMSCFGRSVLALASILLDSPRQARKVGVARHLQRRAAP
eukprot:scaffold23492_cov65-Phaeocystis_antarctica.AAC.9